HLHCIGRTGECRRTVMTEKKHTEKNTSLNVEEALASLEALVEAMEDGNLSLEESLKAFEQGIRLTRECQAALEQAEQKVQLLVREGQLPEAVPYEDEPDKA